jgi:hypothetical protein
MSTLTIILLIYVILDIILDTTAIILLKKKGYSLMGIALMIRNLFKRNDEWESHKHLDEEFTEEDYLDDEDDDILA